MEPAVSPGGAISALKEVGSCRSRERSRARRSRTFQAIHRAARPRDRSVAWLDQRAALV